VLTTAPRALLPAHSRGRPGGDVDGAVVHRKPERLDDRRRHGGGPARGAAADGAALDDVAAGLFHPVDVGVVDGESLGVGGAAEAAGRRVAVAEGLVDEGDVVARQPVDAVRVGEEGVGAGLERDGAGEIAAGRHAQDDVAVARGARLLPPERVAGVDEVAVLEVADEGTAREVAGGRDVGGVVVEVVPKHAMAGAIDLHGGAARGAVERHRLLDLLEAVGAVGSLRRKIALGEVDLGREVAPDVEERAVDVEGAQAAEGEADVGLDGGAVAAQAVDGAVEAAGVGAVDGIADDLQLELARPEICQDAELALAGVARAAEAGVAAAAAVVCVGVEVEAFVGGVVAVVVDTVADLDALSRAALAAAVAVAAVGVGARRRERAAHGAGGQVVGETHAAGVAGVGAGALRFARAAELALLGG